MKCPGTGRAEGMPGAQRDNRKKTPPEKCAADASRRFHIILNPLIECSSNCCEIIIIILLLCCCCGNGLGTRGPDYDCK